MARPTKAKEAKPKMETAGGDSGGLGGIKGIIINAVLTIIIGTIFVGATYLIIDNKLKELTINDPATQAEEHVDAHGEEGHGSMGFPYTLEEFIINLNNPEKQRYLKVVVALEVQRHEGEPELGAHSDEGGGGGHGGGAPADPMEFYNKVMEPFKMSIRDVVISKMSSMSAEELNSNAGKEMAKEAILSEVNSILPEDRQVTRVNFGDFVIQ